MNTTAPDPAPQSIQSDPQLANKTAQALRDALTAMRDLANGWSVEELHLRPREIDLNAQDVLAELDVISAGRCQPTA